MPNTAENNIVARIHDNVKKLVSPEPIKLYSANISISEEQSDLWVTIVRPQATDLPKETIYGISKENNCIYSSATDRMLNTEEIKEFDEISTRMLALVLRKQNRITTKK